jgi:hypothetical protein
MIAWLLTLALAEPTVGDPAVGAAPSASVREEPWRLVAAYDPSAIAVLAGAEPEFLWQPDADLTGTCGAPKSADGLGVFEAEAVANALTPTLALVLERRVAPGAKPPRLTSRDVRVSIGLPDDEDAAGRVLLQPMVEPRDLAVKVDAPDRLSRFGQLVRTQVEVETCLEHKVGRAWTGQDDERMRQAFLLTRPRSLFASRKYFGGQRDPVPALLGPPDACIVGANRERPPGDAPGAGSLTLVPTDVWGASLRACDSSALGGTEIAGDDTLVPLAVTMQGRAQRRPRAWQPLDISLTSAREVPEDADVRVEVRLGATPDGPGECLFSGPLFRKPGESAAVEDVLAMVPQRYPVLVDEEVARAVLLVPGWQVVEALRQVGASTDPASDERRGVAELPPTGIHDAVSFVLAHPEHLFVQLRPGAGSAAEPDASCPEPGAASNGPDAAKTTWPNLAGVLWSRSIRQPWGYTVGLLDGRSAIVLPRREPPTWAQTIRAQRGLEQAALMMSLFLVAGVGLLAFRRVPDLWARIPTERAWYWPGKARPLPAEAELGEKLPDAEIE